MREKLRQNWSFYFIALFMLITLSYILLKGQGIYIQVHDDLDCFTVWLKMLKDNNMFWSIDAEVPFLGGISRNFLHSELKLRSFLHMIFPTFSAVIIAWYIKIIMSILGFIFTANSLSLNSPPPPVSKNIVVFCGFLYGITPTYFPMSIEFASLPFLLGIIIRLYHKPKIKYFILLLFCPFISEFVYFGIFICGYIVCFFLIDWLINKRPKFRLLLAVIALSIGYVLIEWRMFYMMFLSGEKSLRSVSTVMYQIEPGEWLKNFASALVRGHYHSGDLHTYIVLPVCSVYFVVLNRKYIKARKFQKIFHDKYNWLMLFILFNVFIYTTDMLKAFQEFIASVCPPLKGFALGRTLWLNPFLWYLVFAAALCRAEIKTRLKYALCLLAFCVLFIMPEAYNQIALNTGPFSGYLKQTMSQVYYTYVKGEYFDLKEYKAKNQKLTYEEFYSEKLFSKIKQEIGYKGEWSIAYGMHPAIIEYNGIATLDGYHNWYSQSYKEKFRRLIAPELEIDEAKRIYFDNWGGRAYIFSPEVEYNPSREKEPNGVKLYINPEVFREMEGKYIFSRVEITNAEELGFKIAGIFTNEASPYKIYVYD